MKLHFTRKALDTLPLPAPGVGRAEYQDDEIKGLVLRINEVGEKTFSAVRWSKANQKTIRVTLGPYPDVSIEKARKRAREVNEMIAAGTDPTEERRRMRSELTLDQLFEIYLDRWARQRKKTAREDERDYANHLAPRFGNKRLSEIRRPDISRLHSEIGKEQPRTANKILALLSTVFGRAIEWGYADANPIHGLKRYPEKKRDRFLQRDELPRFFDALATLPNPTARDFFLMCLFTGARRSNVLAMRWEEIAFDQAMWRIPETKNGTPQFVVLHRAAVDLLRQRRKAADSPWVFPSTTSKSGHLVEPKKAWALVLKNAQLTDVRIHDLRRTLGSYQAITGASLAVIGKSLNHKSVQATQIYARLDIDPIRDSVQRAVDGILSYARVAPDAPS
ncbi:tyrosine-type recombinase/integrase [Cupriavidus pinatubonensis]|uniref:tyrosine-type recombinase/integrase n=1 Tax=Cupriavidus pinatubonensis TaxID=248026 RepID=UPI00112C3BD9|nr:site-specific integrase [Cupriavidus pinatubonensis]TPQ30920.1 recombinase XerD [Cupriavidus pinatubonensis]